MKRVEFFCITGLALALMLSCTEENPYNFTPNNPGGDNDPGGQGGQGSTSGLMDLGELSDFVVELNTDALQEEETIPDSEDDIHFTDYVENNFNEKTVADIVLSNQSDAAVTGMPDADTVSVDGNNVEIHTHSKGLTLRVSGTTSSGSLKIYSEKKFRLLLSSADITNPEGAAINIQDGNCFVTLEGTNKLSDGSSASYIPSAITPDYKDSAYNEDMKAVLFSEDDIRFNGGGSLVVTSNNIQGKAGIASDDAIFIRPNTNLQVTCGSKAGNAIKANEGVCVKGGVMNLTTAGAGCKGLSSNANMDIDGGRIIIVTSGGVDNSVSSDVKGSAAIKVDSVLNICGGELRLKSTGQGGKGISCDGDINISGGTLRILTSGSQYSSGKQTGMNPGGGQSSGNSSVSPKGIKGDSNITISGGDIMVRTSGSNAEGIESKATLLFTGGHTAVSAYDDGLNASKAINITGGYVFAVSTGQADGIDSNGSISATGGTMIGVASTLGSEEGIDLENSTFTMSNATVMSFGSGSMSMGARYSGHYISTSVSGSAGSVYALCNGNDAMVVFALPRQYSNGKLLLSAPALLDGTYTLKSDVSVSGGSNWMNLYENATISGGTSQSVTAK